MGNFGRWERFTVWFWRKVANRLPASLVYFAMIRVGDVVQEDEKWGRVPLHVAKTRWYVKFMQKREVSIDQS
jgi:hypothetical protein